MKREIFILYLYIAFTIGIDFSDDFAERLAEILSMSKTDVQICMNKTNVVPEDLMKFDQLMYDNVETMDIHQSALKVGCLFACLLQKKGMFSGSHINVEKMKEFMNARMRPNSKDIAIRNRILDKCVDLVKSKTDECEVILKMILCLCKEMYLM